MNSEQIFIFGLLAAVFALMIWGRIRYDFVAFGGLTIASAAGLVPADEVFSGFGHPAVAIIALVLVISAGLTGSGAVELIARRFLDAARSVPAHIGVMSTIGAAMSAVINNVAALSLLMPLDIETARKAKRPVGRTLMPLSFATILGGMITLIGTPPNIVIASYRSETLGTPFAMLDFAPVGLVVTLAGVTFVALVGWRLLPERGAMRILDDEASTGRYVAELRVTDKAAADDPAVRDFYPLAEELDINVLGLVRNGRRRPGFARSEEIRPGDFLVVEGTPKDIEAFMGQASLASAGSEQIGSGLTSESLSLMEAIVPEGARIDGRTARSLRLLQRQSVTLLGVSRGGRRFRDRVRLLRIRPGDVLLLLGTPERTEAAAAWMGVLPLEGRGAALIQRDKAWAAIAIFAVAISLAISGVLALAIALAGAALGYVAMGLVSGREIYQAVEWKVIVLLASLIPLAEAFERVGGAQLLADQILGLTAAWPVWTMLLLLMVVTMTLSDFLNNVATTLIAAPTALGLAEATGTNPDTFLMGVAVAASCAFLTPIGHKNNTIILGPGEYRFGDYWRMGLPLEILVLAVSVPTILIVWPP